MGLNEWVAANYTALIRFSAVYDIVTIGLFALPFSARFQLAALHWIHNAISLSGDLPGDDGYILLFASILGSITLVWSLFRLVKPVPIYGLADGVIAIVYCFNLYYYTASTNLSQVIGIILFLEVYWCVAQIVGFFIWRREHKNPYYRGGFAELNSKFA